MVTDAVWPLEAMPVTVQQPSWLSVGQELTMEVMLVQAAPDPAGTVMHSEPSEDAQLRPPPPLLPPPLDDELHAVSLPAKARPTIPASRIPKS